MSLTRNLFRRAPLRKRRPARPSPCPRCAATIEVDESFCTQCGAKVRTPPWERVETIRGNVARQGLLALRNRIITGRLWILLASVVFLLYGFRLLAARETLVRTIQKADLEMEAQSPESQAETLAEFQTHYGITWDEFVRRSRSDALVHPAAVLVLAGVFSVLYLWSAVNPFAAALTALLIFLTLAAIDLALEPRVPLRSLLVHALVFVGLVSAVSSAYRYRRLSERPERPPSPDLEAPSGDVEAAPPTP